MKGLKKSFVKVFRNGEKGFTLIELLIVIAVLGALAAVVAPNVSGFMASADVAAANTEVANVKTALTAYLADTGAYPSTSSSLNSTYLSGTPKSTYTFNTSSGNISGATQGTWATTITFQVSTQKWIKS